jgi:hypothetical protein
MTAILRWFQYDGHRHRAWYRHSDDGRRELVVAGPDFQYSVPDEQATFLDDLPETRLADLVMEGRAVYQEPPQPRD